MAQPLSGEEQTKRALNWQMVAVAISAIIYAAVVFVRFGEVQFSVADNNKRLGVIESANLTLANATTLMRLELADATAKYQLKLAETMTEQRERISKMEQQIANLQMHLVCGGEIRK